MLLFCVHLHLTGNFWKQDACVHAKTLTACAESFRLDSEGDIVWLCVGLSLNHTAYIQSASSPPTSEWPRDLGVGEVVGTALSPIDVSEVCGSVKHTGIFPNLHVG